MEVAYLIYFAVQISELITIFEQITSFGKMEKMEGPKIFPFETDLFPPFKFIYINYYQYFDWNFFFKSPPSYL